MHLISKLRRYAPVAAIFVLTLVASCGGTKKYGCPNHLSIPVAGMLQHSLF